MKIVSKFVGKHTNEEGHLDKPINILPPLVLTILYILKFQTQFGLLGNSHSGVHFLLDVLIS